MYAIVRSGGRQHKVAVGDVLEIDKVEAKAGDSVALTPLLLVDGEKITADAGKLAAWAAALLMASSRAARFRTCCRRARR